jgi:hypothetical protein
MIDSSRNNYKYRLYGLTISSEIEIPELCVYTGEDLTQYDANINYGVVPRGIDQPIFTTAWCQISKKEFYMYIEGVAHYYVSNGSRIVVEPEEKGDRSQINVFLLGSSLGLLMMQRNTIAIHGGTVEIGGGGIILTGFMGAGKSTLNTAFRKKGYRFLSDDVSALGRDNNGTFMVHPSYPQAKLCRDAALKLGYDFNKFYLIDKEMDKCAVPLLGEFVSESVQLHGIYEISVRDTEEVEITEVLGIEKVKLILRNIYRIELSRFLGFDREYFKQCLEIAESVPVYRLIRPSGEFTVNEQIELIESTLKLIKKEVV